jgi:alpha-L-rhamnosidase
LNEMNAISHMLQVLLVGGLCLTFTTTAGAGSMTLTHLQCDFRTDPMGIDSTNPRLDWILQSSDPSSRDLTQSAYEILAASSQELLGQDRGDLWDSGKVVSDRTSQIPYAGKPLESDQIVFWKARSWDQMGTASDWSPSARLTMGVLKPPDGQAKWITAPNSFKEDDNNTFLLRREFDAKSGLARATVNICESSSERAHARLDQIRQDVSVRFV